MELIYDNVQDDTNYPIITFEAFLQELRESYFNLKEESIDNLFLLDKLVHLGTYLILTNLLFLE